MLTTLKTRHSRPRTSRLTPTASDWRCLNETTTLVEWQKFNADAAEVDWTGTATSWRAGRLDWRSLSQQLASWSTSPSAYMISTFDLRFTQTTTQHQHAVTRVLAPLADCTLDSFVDYIHTDAVNFTGLSLCQMTLKWPCDWRTHRQESGALRSVHSSQFSTNEMRWVILQAVLHGACSSEMFRFWENRHGRFFRF